MHISCTLHVYFSYIWETCCGAHVLHTRARRDDGLHIFWDCWFNYGLCKIAIWLASRHCRRTATTIILQQHTYNQRHVHVQRLLHSWHCTALGTHLYLPACTWC
jgi:hypothetical protein